MFFGLTLSVVAHLALLGWALINFQATPPLKIKEPEAVEVALISPDDLVRLTKGDRSSKNLKTRASKQLEKAPVKKNAVKPVVRTVPRAAAVEPPTPKSDDIAKKIASLQPPKPTGPTAAELAAKAAAAAKAAKAAEQQRQVDKAAAELALKQAAEAEAKKKAEAAKKAAEAAKQRKAEARRKKRAEERRKKLAAKREKERKRKLAEKRQRELEAKRRKFDPGRVAALLNKIPDSKAPDAGSVTPDPNRQLPKGPAAGAPDGTASRLTASQVSLLGSMMKRAVSKCWNINSGLDGIDRVVVEVEIKLRPDGSLKGEPKVTNSGRGALFQDASNNAMRAIVQCAPYTLPKPFYKGGWDHMVVTFDPQKMF